jgi:predicted transcriptional regulator
MDDANVAQVPVIEEDEIVGILSREQARHHTRLRTTLGV